MTDPPAPPGPDGQATDGEPPEAVAVLTRRFGYEDSHTLARYLATGGYDGLRRALTMTPRRGARGGA